MLDGQISAPGFVRPQLDALLEWWATAGVDCVLSEEPVNWFRPPPSKTAPIATPQTHDTGTDGKAQPAEQSVKSGPGWPDDMAAFHSYLSTAGDLPECRWPGNRVLPQGPQTDSPVMIILPAPDARASQDGEFLGPDAMRLLGNMLGAIGLKTGEYHLASLSLIAPPGGMLDADIIAPLVRRMRHHINILSPRALLLVGDQTNRAFTPTGGTDGDWNLPRVNQKQGSLPVASILHPRLILEQPSAKMGAWRSLRTLFGGLKV